MHPQVIQNILQSRSFIDQHLSDDLDGEHIASQACLSYFHFHHQFRAITGESVWQYVKRLRLEKGAFLMAFSHLPVADIAIQCGFDTTSSFSKAFRQKHGMSPQHFRSAAVTHGSYNAPALDWNKVTIRRLPAQSIFSIRSEGIEQCPKGYFRWMQQMESLKAGKSVLIGKSPDQPGFTSGNKLRWDTGIATTQTPQVLMNGPETKEWVLEEALPGGKYLVVPFHGFGSSYIHQLPAILMRLQQEGLQWNTSGKIFQVLQQHAPGNQCHTEIHVPVV